VEDSVSLSPSIPGRRALERSRQSAPLAFRVGVWLTLVETSQGAYHSRMRRLRRDVVLIAAGATLIVGATLAHPAAAVSAAAGVSGFLLVLAGAYLSRRGLRTPGGPPPGGGFWGGMKTLERRDQAVLRTLQDAHAARPEQRTDPMGRVFHGADFDLARYRHDPEAQERDWLRAKALDRALNRGRRSTRPTSAGLKQGFRSWRPAKQLRRALHTYLHEGAVSLEAAVIEAEASLPSESPAPEPASDGPSGDRAALHERATMLMHSDGVDYLTALESVTGVSLRVASPLD
jgi:hypothetical protein